MLLDEQARPWLLEINHSPSLATDTPLDRELKSTLLSDTMCLCAFSAAEERVLKRAADRDGKPPAAVPKAATLRRASAGGMMRSGTSGGTRGGGRFANDGGFSALRSRLEAAREHSFSRPSVSATNSFSSGVNSVASSLGLGSRGLSVLGAPGLKQQLVQEGLQERRQQAVDQHEELIRLRQEYEAANPGLFELVYPAEHDQKLQSMYEMLTNASLRAFIEESPVNFNGGNRVPIPPLLPPSAGEDWWSMIKLGRTGQRIMEVRGDAPSAKKNAQRERDKAEAARIAAAEASMADAYDDNY